MAQVTMTKERQGEIALIAIKAIIKRKGIQLNTMKRDAHSEAQRLGISEIDFLEFQEIVCRELFEEAFAQAK